MHTIYRYLTYLLPFLLWLNLCLPGFTQPADTYTPSDFPPTTEADYWLETVYAMGGSAAGNGGALVLFMLLDILPTVVSSFSEEPAGDWIGSFFYLMPLLLILPMIGSAGALYFYFPKPDDIEINIWWTLLGGALSTLLHAAIALIPLLLIFDQGSLQQTVYTIAPAAFISAVLIEGAGTALFYDQTRTWKLETTHHGGLILAQKWTF